MKLSIWHNILWARYKGAVFSALHRHATASGIQVEFFQIAETENDRVALSPVDANWHDYPYELLFKGAYSSVPRWALLRELARRAWADKSDLTILTGYERPEVWLQACILALRGKRFAWFCDSTVHDNPQTRARRLAKTFLFSLASGIFCYGQRSSAYIALHGVRDDRIFVRRQAAALPKDYSRSRTLRHRIERMAGCEAPRYLYVGRLSGEKSLDKLLRAFAKAVSQLPEAKLVLVGKGPHEPTLRSLCSELAIVDKVEFAGSKFDEDLVDQYLRATCLVLPSFSEPWGLVVNESLSYGCPAIVSDRCGCVPELVVHGVTGFSYNWASVDELSDRLVRAPVIFKDAAKTAEQCLNHIEPFNPDNAALAILSGSRLIAKGAS